MDLPPRPSKPGCYVAHHKWLDTEFGPGALHKVGFTSELGARLDDSSYVTCFVPGWRYIATFETASKEDAHLLETAVLHACRDLRVDTRELVRAPAETLVALLERAAAALGLGGELRRGPTYAPKRRPPAPRPPGAPPPPPRDGPGESPRFTAPLRAAVDELARTLLRPGAPPAAPDCSDLLDELAEWALMSPPPARPDAVVDALTGAVAALTVDTPPAPKKPLPPVPAKAAPPLADAAEPLAEDLDLDWVDLAGAGASPFDLAAGGDLELRAYQAAAAERALAELRRSHRAILQMACRCGKTMVAHRVARPYLEAGGTVLVLVPGLSLLRQTAQKLAAYGLAAPLLLVGSDARAVPLEPAQGATEARTAYMTTDPGTIAGFFAARAAAAAAPEPPGPPVPPRGAGAVVVCTYQSSPVLLAAAPGPYALTLFDECHRICGGAAPRPFNHVLAAPPTGDRLFLTATPAYEGAISMKDRAAFGGVAYRYHLREGIAAGYVNDFRLCLVAAKAAATPLEALRNDPAPGQILAAMGVEGLDKLLVFCRDTAHAARLRAAVAELAGAAGHGVAPFECLEAHSRLGPYDVAAALKRFSAPGVRAALFNCRMFQEGVEIPALNGVFFAAPRHSPRDIIQSICRPLNKLEGKPQSVVFLPVVTDPGKPPEAPENLKRFADIVPFVDALLSEDPQLYEHLLDPAKAGYPIECLGTHSLRLTAPAEKRALLSAVRRAARNGTNAASTRQSERLLRADQIPWSRGFEEVKRIVDTCKRYPKTCDLWIVGEAKVRLYNFYKRCCEGYQLFLDGKPTFLEPHQLRDLESLNMWIPFGLEGPYPWKLCMEFLEQWLEEHQGIPPMVEINKGGYIGLEASAIERLSGCCTIINQSDGCDRKGGKPGSGFIVPKEKQEVLDRICARFGLTWRKRRDAEGRLDPNSPKTFIQEAHARFKEYYKQFKAGLNDGAYIRTFMDGYPVKNRFMENFEVQQQKLAPPRVKPARQRFNKEPRDSRLERMNDLFKMVETPETARASKKIEEILADSARKARVVALVRPAPPKKAPV